MVLGSQLFHMLPAFNGWSSSPVVHGPVLPALLDDADSSLDRHEVLPPVPLMLASASQATYGNCPSIRTGYRRRSADTTFLILHAASRQRSADHAHRRRQASTLGRPCQSAWGPGQFVRSTDASANGERSTTDSGGRTCCEPVVVSLDYWQASQSGSSRLQAWTLDMSVAGAAETCGAGMASAAASPR